MATPIWPDSLNSLADRGSWGLNPKTDNARSDFDKGPARTRRRFSRSTSQVEFTVTMRGLEFEAFKTFVEVETQGATAWFMMPVFTGLAYEVSLVRFTDQETPYKVSEHGFGQVRVAMALETRRISLSLAPGAAWLVGQWGGAYVEEFADRLQTLVNVKYPQIWD